MAAPAVQVQVSTLQNALLVKIVGELRLNIEATALDLDRAVIIHHPKLVVVDCSQLSFISSLGMSLLINLRNAVTRTGGTVALACLTLLVEGALRHASIHT